MNWQKKNYAIYMDDLKPRFADGVSNGLLGISFDFTLTHLKTGFKIADFRDEQSAKRVADYLSETYAAEFAALDKEYQPPMTHDEYKKLVSAKDLNCKIKRDAYFHQLLRDFGFALPEHNH